MARLSFATSCDLEGHPSSPAPPIEGAVQRMDQVNLAHNMPVYQYALSVLILAFLIGAFVFVLVPQLRLGKPPKFKGPALTGTAQVLSDRMLVGNETWKRRLTLKVEIPGHAPYDVKMNVSFDFITDRIAFGLDRQDRGPQPGRIVPVQVDSTNLQRVRIDYVKALPQPGSYGWPGTTTGSISYGAQPQFHGPQPPTTKGGGMTAPSWPPGWYPSPGGEPGQRYWDGSAWTEHRAVNRTSTTRVLPPVLLMLALFPGMLALVFFFFAASAHHNYSAGTPARATITDCSGGKDSHCWAEWTTADGRSGGGIIEGGLFDGSDRVGTTLDVHVNRKGIPYAPRAGLGSAVIGGVCLVVSISLLIGAATVFLIRKRR